MTTIKNYCKIEQKKKIKMKEEMKMKIKKSELFVWIFIIT
jgi:hypothetical protein